MKKEGTVEKVGSVVAAGAAVGRVVVGDEGVVSGLSEITAVEDQVEE